MPPGAPSDSDVAQLDHKRIGCRVLGEIERDAFERPVIPDVKVCAMLWVMPGPPRGPATFE